MHRTKAVLYLWFALIPVFGSALLAIEQATESGSLRAFRPERRAEQEAVEEALLGLVSADSLRAIHDLVSSRPHVAGTPGDREVIDNLAASYRRLGLEVEEHEFWAYLPRPVDAELEILSPEPLELALRERPVGPIGESGHPEADFGWNAYSASGEIAANVVYANYGTRSDFERLEELGIDVEGKIVIARYGRNYRGHKAVFAERAGAGGLLIYSDPEDAGYIRGLMYPEGGWANGSYIQRGSILVLPYSGDPLTPFEEATRDAERLDPAQVDLPGIPVQPIGWEAASEILERMAGRSVPEEWQGGLPFNYRLEGGNELQIRLRVEQQTEPRRSANVLGRLRGSRYPEELVIIGSHHDAWSFGAGDPNAGTIVVYEVARIFSELARRGVRPDRTLVFANWGAEEFGIIGSVEWVEANRDELAANAVAYINLDGAAMGPDFSASASPLLKDIVLAAAASVPSPISADTSVLDSWIERTAAGSEEPRIGNLGGGSDHVGFYCHLGIPSVGISGQGSSGVSYHSNYENLSWYRQVVGNDYESALMLSRVVGLMASRLSNADLLPLSFERFGDDLALHAENLARLADDERHPDLNRLAEKGRAWSAEAAETRLRILRALDREELSDEALSRINSELLRLGRIWVSDDGLPGRPWFRNLFAATDEDSGYAAWMLPVARWAIERNEPLEPQIRRYEPVLDELTRRLENLERALEDSTENPT